ncbi:MAG: SCO family protein [Myxococcota bacterium]|nr:SCO family protein [Myxococcota bacterium]
MAFLIGRAALAVAMGSLAAVFACSQAPALEGIVEATEPGDGRILVARVPVSPGTDSESAWLALPNRSVLGSLAPGQRVAYRLRSGSARPEIASLSVLGWASEADGWIEVPGRRRVRAVEAPDFQLDDQAGLPVRMADTRGQVVLVDFIYTRCPGPCPAQTHDLVTVQQGLSEAARSGSRFFSVTLEPEVDDGPTLEVYARARGADLADWSFLTGDPDRVHAVARAWGVGASLEDNGEIAHTLHSFLVDDRGYRVARYSSRDRDPETIRQDIERFVEAARARSPAVALP